MLIESISLGLISGAVFYSQFSHPIPVGPIIEAGCLLVILACLYIVYAKKLKFGRYLYLFSVILAFLFEIIWTNYHAQQILEWQLPSRYQNQITQIKGQVKGVPYFDKLAKEAKFILSAEELCLINKHAAPDCMALQSTQNIKLYGTLPLNNNHALESGDQLVVTAKIKKPWSVSNPGGFDAEKNAFLNQIKATGNIKTLISHQSHADFRLDNLRQKISDKMVTSLQEDSLSGMLIGLTIGVTDRISQVQWALLRNTGTTHLIAISGLHISLIGGLVFGLMTLLWRCAPRLLLWMPAKIAAAYLTLLFIWGYGFLAGMSIATERACIMMSALMLAIILKLRMSAGFVFSASLVIILIWDPFAVLSIGFWLSYLAIGILVFATGNRLKFTRKKLSWKLIRPQLAVFLGMLPVSLYFFQSASLISPLVNLIAIPWVSFVVTPACLLSALAFMLNIDWLGKIFIILAKYLYLPMWEIMQWIVNKMPAVWHFALPHSALGVTLFMLSSLGMVILLLPKGIPHKNWIGTCLASAILFYQPLNLKKGECHFALLDVGQGLASVIFTKNHVLIYDTGPKWKEADSGTQVIQPFLDYYHVDKIDTIMISHTDLDHRGGLDSLLQHYPVKKIITSEIDRLELKANLNHLKPVLCEQGQIWEWDGVLFEVLHPGGQAEKNRNNLSCVLKVSTGKNSILLTGDIEAGAEKTLLETYKEKLITDILIAPHHGSKTSSTKAFIEQVQPTFVLFPTGKDNRFGFPIESVTTRYAELGCQLLDTAKDGAIIFDLTPEQILPPISWRSTQTRFWHNNA